MFRQSRQFCFFLEEVQLLLVFFQYIKKFTFVFFIPILNFFFNFFFVVMLDGLANILFMLFNLADIAQYFVFIYWFSLGIMWVKCFDAKTFIKFDDL